jgi:hypothetical protein
VLLGVAEGTVKSRCHRARQALRAALADPQAGGPQAGGPQAGGLQAHRRQAWGTP